MKEESTHERNHEATFAHRWAKSHSERDSPRIRRLAAQEWGLLLPTPPPRKAAAQTAGQKVNLTLQF